MILQEMDISLHLIPLAAGLYESTGGSVRQDQIYSEEFQSHCQYGSPSELFIFISAIRYLWKIHRDKLKDWGKEFVVNNRGINNLRFADNTA